MIDLKQLLESEEHESERLVSELEAHEASWPALKTEFDKIDNIILQFGSNTETVALWKFAGVLQ